MNYYRRFRDIREDKDLTQKEIADKIGTTQQYYAQYENGHRLMTFDRAVEIAKVLNISLDYIAGFIDEPKPLRDEKN